MAKDMYFAAIKYVQNHTSDRSALMKEVLDVVLDEFSEYDLYYRGGKHMQGLIWTTKPLASYTRDPRLLEREITGLVSKLERAASSYL